MQREGQPNGIQWLFRSFKRAEAHRNQRPQREPEGTNHLSREPEPQRRPSFENDPRLTQESKAAIRAELQALRERADRSFKEHWESSYNQPGQTYIEIDGIRYTGAAAWEAFQRKKRSEERLTTIAPLVPEQRAPGTTTKEKGKGIATNMYRTLAQEVAGRQLLEAGNILQKEVWKDDPHNPRTTVRRYGDMHITMNHQTGLVKDRSHVGFALSNPAEEKEIYYGIGYFENPENFVPAGRGSVRSEDLKKGAKAYFIERTHREKKELLVIPFAYEEATSEFFDRLYETAIELAPAQVRHRRNLPLAAAA